MAHRLHGEMLLLVPSVLKGVLSVFQVLGRPSLGRRWVTQRYGTLRQDPQLSWKFQKLA